MKINKNIIILILIIILAILAILIVTHLNDGGGAVTNGNQTVYHEVLANNSNDPGTVEVIRNIGNPHGKKIAYVVGLHPLEYQTHRTLVSQLQNMSNLNNSYDIYIINVTRDVGHYGDGSSDNSQGRQNGQNLAYQYVYPQIVNGSYDLAIDIHSNVGAYPYRTFVFSPVNEGLGESYASEVAGNCPNISYYSPESTTSGPYLTIPLNKNGVPAFYYEEYSFASQDVKNEHMVELILAVDNLQFK